MQFPTKYFYTIGDVSEITKVKPHILRYWESHFKVLRPARRYSGHRKYTQREVDLINRIRYLVIDRKFTLSGARKEVNRQLNAKTKPSKESSSVHVSTGSASLIREIKGDVEDCLQILNKKNKPVASL